VVAGQEGVAKYPWSLPAILYRKMKVKNRISPILKTVFLAPLHATPLTRSGTPACSNHVYRLMAAICLQMRRNPVNVVLDGEFRQPQTCGDLFVRHPFGN
jgi:hypothetical protein